LLNQDLLLNRELLNGDPTVQSGCFLKRKREAFFPTFYPFLSLSVSLKATAAVAAGAAVVAAAAAAVATAAAAAVF